MYARAIALVDVRKAGIKNIPTNNEEIKRLVTVINLT
jgi:hypothetical protein